MIIGCSLSNEGMQYHADFLNGLSVPFLTADGFSLSSTTSIRFLNSRCLFVLLRRRNRKNSNTLKITRVTNSCIILLFSTAFLEVIEAFSLKCAVIVDTLLFES